jgi:hypothetical protein
MLFTPGGIFPAGIELRLAPGSLLSLGDLGATSSRLASDPVVARRGGTEPTGSVPTTRLLAPLLTTMGGRSLADAERPAFDHAGSKVRPSPFDQRHHRLLDWLPFVAPGVCIETGVDNTVKSYGLFM